MASNKFSDSMKLSNIWSDLNETKPHLAHAEQTNVVRPLESKSIKQNNSIVGKLVAVALIAFLVYCYFQG